ncbi:MAG: insulinase family protein [Fibrobacter sp.]|jgi:zinc protease|nr:insulinase family protein [Fibrobacter sp.]
MKWISPLNKFPSKKSSTTPSKAIFKESLMPFKMTLFFLILLIFGCSSTPVKNNVSEVTPVSKTNEEQVVSKSTNKALPSSYKEISFPEFTYVAPHPKEYRVQLDDSITGYVVVDRSLPLISFSMFFKEATIPSNIKETAALELLSPMFRRGGSSDISANALDDSLEFISASVHGGLGSYYSKISIDCLSKNFEEMLSLSKSVFTKPGFDEKQLEIQKTSYITAYKRRFDNPASILSALRSKVNYASSPRLWNPTVEEYQSVSKKDLEQFGKTKFSANRIVFALAGDIEKDSALVLLKKYFADWKKSSKRDLTPSILLLKKPGVYAVEKDITQANISMNQPFVKRPHPDYYPTAVASFILGGGSFSSRLTSKIRTEEGLAYSIYSHAGNDFNDTALTTIALQTKAESAFYAIQLIIQEIEKLSKEGPSAEELELAKKTLIESLPSMFDSPSSIASIFAADEIVGKSKDHYLEYVKAINAVTPEQIKAMTAKYFDPQKMTISIVGPKKSWDKFENVTIIPIQDLYFR